MTRAERTIIFREREFKGSRLRCVLTRSEGVIPDDVWGKTFHVDGTPLTVLVRSAAVGINARTLSSGAKS
jgi:hypothetical protein